MVAAAEEEPPLEQAESTNSGARTKAKKYRNRVTEGTG